MGKTSFSKGSHRYQLRTRSSLLNLSKLFSYFAMGIFSVRECMEVFHGNFRENSLFDTTLKCGSLFDPEETFFPI